MLQYLAERTAAGAFHNSCVVTLPIRTFDNRLVDVFIEERQSDFYLVHDAGKAANELILRGGNITKSVNERYAQIAENFGVAWRDEMFQFGCKFPLLAPTAYAVAMCSAIATLDLLSLCPMQDDETVREQFGHALKGWSRKRVKIKDRLTVPGEWKQQHTFDFVAYPKSGSPIAINVLTPGSSSISAAERAAFRQRDLENTAFGGWRKVSVATGSEMWSHPARELVERCSDLVVGIGTGEAPTADLIERTIGKLIKAA
jgi:hypothetical protein